MENSAPRKSNSKLIYLFTIAIFTLIIFISSELIYFSVNQPSKLLLPSYIFLSKTALKINNPQLSANFFYQASAVKLIDTQAAYPDINLNSPSFQSPKLNQSQKQDIASSLGTIPFQELTQSDQTSPNDWAKYLYNLGLVYYQHQLVDATLSLWTLASNISPEWGYLYQEISNLYLLQDQSLEANQTIRSCYQFDYPKIPCQRFYQENILTNTTETVGFWSEAINTDL